MTRRTLFTHLIHMAAPAALLGVAAAGCRAGAPDTANANPAPAAQPSAPRTPETMMFFVGTYAKPDAPGIYAFEMDSATGKLTPREQTSGISNPSFLAVHPSGRYLYAASEAGAGVVQAFAVDRASGKLTPLNQESSKGGGPCYVAVTADGRYVLVANYGSGSVAALPIGADGKLSPAAGSAQHQGPSQIVARRQDNPHAHSINPDPTGKFAVAADLGLDKLLVYRLDGPTPLAPADPAYTATAPGAGPRHTAFHPDGEFLYAINELNSTVTAYSWDAAKGTLSPIQTEKTLPADFTGNSSTAEVAVHPSGRFLYGSNRGHDSLAIFRINLESGRLTAIGHEPTQGKTPRHFAIDPTGNFLIAANQETGNLVVFRINAETGKLTATGETASVPKAVCVRFVR